MSVRLTCNVLKLFLELHQKSLRIIGFESCPQKIDFSLICYFSKLSQYRWVICDKNFINNLAPLCFLIMIPKQYLNIDYSICIKICRNCKNKIRIRNSELVRLRCNYMKDYCKLFQVTFLYRVSSVSFVIGHTAQD